MVKECCLYSAVFTGLLQRASMGSEFPNCGATRSSLWSLSAKLQLAVAPGKDPSLLITMAEKTLGAGNIPSGSLALDYMLLTNCSLREGGNSSVLLPGNDCRSPNRQKSKRYHQNPAWRFQEKEARFLSKPQAVWV